MMRTIPACIALLFTFTSATADGWRDMMRHLVEKAGKQYELSHRRGILLYADSIKAELPNSPTRNDSLEFTADYLKLMGDYHYENSNRDTSSFSIAEDYFKETLSIYETNEDVFGHMALECSPMIHRELAQLYYKQARYREAREEMAEAYAAYKEAADLGGIDPEIAPDLYMDYLSMRSYLAICDARLGKDCSEEMDQVISFYEKSNASHEAQEYYYEALRKKGKIIMLAGGNADQALPYYKAYFNFRKSDALKKLYQMTAEEREDYWMRMRPFVADAYQTEDADAAFLYDITLFAKGLLLQIERLSGRGKTTDEALSSLSNTWRDVGRQLEADECAVEFVQYEKGGRRLMAALVLRGDSSPRWVPMIAPDELLSRDCDGKTCEERLSSANGYSKDPLYNDSTLPPLLWNAHLREAIKGCRKVFFSPDGYLHTLAIEYMLPEGEAALKPQPLLYRLTSTRQLLVGATGDHSGSSLQGSSPTALLIGGVRYDSGPVDSLAAKPTNNDSIARNFIFNRGGRFNYLSGTKQEIESIYASRNNATDTLLTGTMATEAAFRNLCSAYPIVNISTHGYFGETEDDGGTDLKPCLDDESLSHSIIALAGCNAATDHDIRESNDYDGLLSAREISRLDMSQTQLAIISACQTGLGYITADGVYGIQRGLKNAGVGSMIVSLWNVSDEATCRLMTSFHSFLSQGMTTAGAFRAARQALADSSGATHTKVVRFNASRLAGEEVALDEDVADYSAPQYSNAFILIDATE